MDSNFFNYADMYKSPTEANNLPQNLIGYYSTALLSGGSSAQPIFADGYSASDLPGNRYFIDTQTQCEDTQGQMQKRSILIDNVMESTMNRNPVKERGLMYSLFASLGSISTSNTAPSLSPSSSPAVIQTNTIPQCQLVKVKSTDNSQENTIKAYVSDADFDKIDPYAIVEGLSPMETWNQTKKTATDHGTKTQAETRSVIKSKQTARDNAKADAKTQGKTKRKGALLKSYYRQYGKTPMAELFPTFLTYSNSNTIEPSCIYETLASTQPDGSNQTALDFVEALKKSAQFNETNQSSFKIVTDDKGVSQNFTTSFIPKKTIMLGFGGATTPNPEYVAFWNALEGYRIPIINALMKTDHPTTFGSCSNDNTNANEGFTGMWESSDFTPEIQSLLFLFVLLIAILCVWYRH